MQPIEPDEPAVPAAAPAIRLVADNESPAPWKRSLQYTSKHGTSELVGCLTNAVLILTHDRAFAGCFRRDTFSGRVHVSTTLPTVMGLDPPATGDITDGHVAYVVSALCTINKLFVGFDLVARAIDAAADQRSYHPLQDYLGARLWDGTLRLDTWLTRYLDADDTHYTRRVGRMWLVSAIARAYQPGCQADLMLVLEGPQGSGKSTAARILGGEWTLHKLPDVRDYERAAHALAGRWIGEVGELDGLRAAALSRVKDFISMPVDDYRCPYARHPVHRPRSAVFVATTNDAHYLRDATGARRFLPVAVRQLDRQSLTRDRDQLLAEARLAFEGGAQWWPDDADLADLRDAQEERYDADAWEPRIAAWLDATTPGAGQPRDAITTGEILSGCISLDPGHWGRDEQTRVGTALRRLGWLSKREQEHGVRVRRYYRPESKS